jgi:hypothetical protein
MISPKERKKHKHPCGRRGTLSRGRRESSTWWLRLRPLLIRVRLEMTRCKAAHSAEVMDDDLAMSYSEVGVVPNAFGLSEGTRSCAMAVSEDLLHARKSRMPRRNAAAYRIAGVPSRCPAASGTIPTRTSRARSSARSISLWLGLGLCGPGAARARAGAA